MIASRKILIGVGLIFVIGIAISYQIDAKNSSEVSNINSIASSKVAKSSTNSSVFTKANKTEEEKGTRNQDSILIDRYDKAMVKYDIASIDDITDDMILEQTIGYNETQFSSNYTDYNFKVSADYFLGCDYLMEISAKQKSKITIHYTTSMKKNTLKMALILGGKKVKYLPVDKQKATYTIPKGNTKFVLIGYKASGDIDVTMDKVKGVKFVQNSEW